MSIWVFKSMPCIGHVFSSLLYLSHAVYKLSSSPCLNTTISLLLLDVRDGGKNLPREASTSSSHVSTEPYGNESNHVATISLKEKGKCCSLITSSLTPFGLTVLAILRNLPRCSLGSSVGWHVNWFCCTKVINAGLSSKLLASIAGCLTAEYCS